MGGPPDISAEELFARISADGALARLLAAARDEDLSMAGDVTTHSIVPRGHPGRAAIVAREEGVLAGLRTVPALLGAFGAELTHTPAAEDGASCAAGQTLGTLAGPLADILRVERTMLNLVGLLSGVATLTRRFVDAVAGTPARICATRKTTPGLRALQKYAVLCGGGDPHRMGLYDAVLYKDNHLAHVAPCDLGDVLGASIASARAAAPLRFVEVEVDTLVQLRAVLGLAPAAVDMVLLDNMGDADLRAAVRLREEMAPTVLLEASGGVALETVRGIAETGVDRISVGALTHSAASLDVGLDVT